MTISKNLIPKFENEEQEAEYWDKHSPLDLVTEPKLDKVKIGGTKDRPIAIRLDSKTRTKLNELATKQGLGPSTFARRILTAAIEQENRPCVKKTIDEVMEAFDRNIPMDEKNKIETLLRTFAIGNPPYLLELTDKRKIEEFSHLFLATLLSLAGIEVVSHQDAETQKGRDTITLKP